MLLLLLGWASGGSAPSTASIRIGGNPVLLDERVSAIPTRGVELLPRDDEELVGGNSLDLFPSRTPQLF